MILKFFRQRCFKSSKYDIINLLKAIANKNFFFVSYNDDDNGVWERALDERSLFADKDFIPGELSCDFYFDAKLQIFIKEYRNYMTAS